MRVLHCSILLAVFTAAFATHCSHAPPQLPGDPKLRFAGETRLENIRQLSRGGTNAEAYWSFSGQKLTFQHKGPINGAPGPECDQIYTMNPDASELRMLSNGKGRTTCSFFLPNDERVLFSSTFVFDESCPPKPDMSQGYVWPVYPTYQIFAVKTDGKDLLPFEPGEPRAYNAEATVCKDGNVIFTSDRDGDLELYRGKTDHLGTLNDVTRVTHAVGYDGGAFFSPDCRQIVWRASRPRDEKETAEYQRLLKQHLVKPTQMELWIANADGTHARQLTHLGAASFAPSFAPDGQRIIFASNLRDPHGRGFDLYLIRTDGTRLERVTYSDSFDSFPMFSPDGKTLAFSSNRNGSEPHETNVFLADWADKDPSVPLKPDDADPANRFKAVVEQLSAPEMEGRGPGTAGAAKAQDLVATQFATIGLKPFFEDGFKQKFEMAVGKERHVVADNNVVGRWGGACGKVAPVVVGAHLDHLGMGGPESLESTQKGLHPGADDNASGVAAVLEAARVIVAHADAKKSCFVFAAFAGEEVAVAGSSRFVEYLKAHKIQPKAMLNLDMVGRLENNHLIVFGSDSAKEWRSILAPACADESLKCDGGGDGYGPSDHMAFYVMGVPVLHFFTGPHADYHRTTDTADKINATGGVQVSQVVAAVALRAASPKQRLHYQKASGTPSMGKLTGKGQHAGHGAYLGTIPDYATLSSPHGPGGGGEATGGVRLAGTRSGSPADKAGVKEGDVLMAIEVPGGADGKKTARVIGTLDDFMNILLDLKPGDEIALHLRRNGKEIILPAKVGKRE